MELRGVIAALDRILASGFEGCNVILTTDSKYVTDAFNQRWIEGWLRRNWKTVNGTPVANQQLWVQLIVITSKLKVCFKHVKGHNGHQLNERCDNIARMYALEAKKGCETVGNN